MKILRIMKSQITMKRKRIMRLENNKLFAIIMTIFMTISLLASSIGSVFAEENSSDTEYTRILVNTTEKPDKDTILAEYDNTYLLQYDSEQEATKAYDKLSKNAEFISLDYNFSIAETNKSEDTINIDEMTNDENPLAVLQDQINSDNEVLEEAKAEAKKEGSNPDDLSFPHFNIALIDTGVAEDSDAFAVSVLPDGSIYDVHGHGTTMYNTIKGINKDASILSIKAMDDEGKGSISSIYAAVQYAIERDVDIINLSISAYNTLDNSSLEYIVNEAVDKGIVVVGAAGNDGKDVKDFVPGNIEKAVIAGSCDKDGNKKSFTNYGDTVDFYVISDSTSVASATISAYLSNGDNITSLGNYDGIFATENSNITVDTDADDDSESNNTVEYDDYDIVKLQNDDGDELLVRETDEDLDDTWIPVDVNDIEINDDAYTFDDNNVLENAFYKDGNIYFKSVKLEDFNVASTAGANLVVDDGVGVGGFAAVSTNPTGIEMFLIPSKIQLTSASQVSSTSFEYVASANDQWGNNHASVCLKSGQGWTKRGSGNANASLSNSKNSLSHVSDKVFTVTFPGAVYDIVDRVWCDLNYTVTLNDLYGVADHDNASNYAQTRDYPMVMYVTKAGEVHMHSDKGTGMKYTITCSVTYGGQLVGRPFSLYLSDLDAKGYSTDRVVDSNNNVTYPTAATSNWNSQVVYHGYEASSSHSYGPFCETISWSASNCGIDGYLYDYGNGTTGVAGFYSTNHSRLYTYHGDSGYDGNQCGYKVKSNSTGYITFNLAQSVCGTEISANEIPDRRQRILIKYQNVDGTYPSDWTSLVDEKKEIGTAVNYDSIVSNNINTNNATGVYNINAATVDGSKAPDFVGYGANNYQWTVGYNNTVYITIPRKTVHALVQVRHQNKDGNWSSYVKHIDQDYLAGSSISWNFTPTTDSLEGTNKGKIYNRNVTNYSGSATLTSDYTVSVDVPRIRYTYSFDGNKPANATNNVTNIPGAITKLAENTPGNVGNASLKGWTFLGWNTDKNATSGNYNPNEVMLSNKKFYALWRPNKYYIKYDPNKDQEPNIDGDYEYHTVTGTMADQTMYYDTAANLTANAYARKGYKWLSWNTKADGTGTTYTDKQSVINLTDQDEGVITLYAQWEKLKSSSTLTVISEETGVPIKGVEVKLQKKLNGKWVDVSSNTTNDNGLVSDNNLDWFDYRYIPVKIPAGYEPWEEDSLTFKVDQDNLPRHDLMTVLLMKRVDITVNSTVNDIIKGEDGPAIAYIVEGTDVAGVKHRYTLMNQIDVESLRGSDTTAKIFAGTYDITAIPISRYYLLSKTDRQNVEENGDVERADVIENKHAEITYNYEMKQYEGFSSVDSVVNHIGE